MEEESGCGGQELDTDLMTNAAHRFEANQLISSS